MNAFDNHNTPDKGVSKLCLLNELDDSLLLVASSEPLTVFEVELLFFCLFFHVFITDSLASYVSSFCYIQS